MRLQQIWAKENKHHVPQVGTFSCSYDYASALSHHKEEHLPYELRIIITISAQNFWNAWI